MASHLLLRGTVAGGTDQIMASHLLLRRQEAAGGTEAGAGGREGRPIGATLFGGAGFVPDIGGSGRGKGMGRGCAAQPSLGLVGGRECGAWSRRRNPLGPIDKGRGGIHQARLIRVRRNPPCQGLPRMHGQLALTSDRQCAVHPAHPSGLCGLDSHIEKYYLPLTPPPIPPHCRLADLQVLCRPGWRWPGATDLTPLGPSHWETRCRAARNGSEQRRCGGVI